MYGAFERTGTFEPYGLSKLRCAAKRRRDDLEVLVDQIDGG
jgi:hypothetical protein